MPSPTCFWVDTERTLQQVVHALGHVDIQPRVRPLELHLHHGPGFGVVRDSLPTIKGGHGGYFPLLVQAGRQIAGKKSQHLAPPLWGGEKLLLFHELTEILVDDGVCTSARRRNINCMCRLKIKRPVLTQLSRLDHTVLT